jgi:2-polyprenyl-3-methyl-5-hydroxy-6-metoxy-1,4-benzoquinol methylase
METSFSIDLLPFYWRLSNKNDQTNNVVNSNFPFEFDIDTRHSLLIQKRNNEVLKALNIVYQEEYNIGYLQDQNLIAKQYGTDFFEFCKTHVFVHKRIRTALEIGCGGCVMLSKLQSIGYEVTGIDSSPFAFNEGRKKGIHVIQDFFPSKSLSTKFDLIFHVDVLEHVDDYVGFLRSQYDQLNDHGFLVVNVPDASESIKLGDFSLAMHQHLNYFSTTSLTSVLESSGFKVMALERAGYGGSLYAIAAKNTEESDFQLPIESDEKQFLVTAAQSADKFSRVIHEILASHGSTLGFYVPLRALPYVAKTKLNCDFRFFDDTPHWHHLFFDGIDVKIENFDDLVRNPVTHMVIMSFTFADAIKNKIHRKFGDSIEVLTLDEIISKSF